MNATLDQLIDDIEAINKKLNIMLPYDLHAFLHKLDEHGMMPLFELFLRKYRSSKEPKQT